MTTAICSIQVQPGSAAVHETAMVLDPIKDAPGRRLAGRESVNNSHACDVIREQADQTVEREPYDTTLVLKPILCESNVFENPRTTITQ